MVNGSRRIFVERHGLVREITDVRVDERNLKVAVKNIARALGDDVSEDKPILDSRLPDGSRVAAVLPPCSLGGTTLTIRKFQTRFFTADELVRIGTMTADVLATVRYQIADAIALVLHLGRDRGARVVKELIKVERYDVQRDGYDHVVLFHRNRAVADAGTPVAVEGDVEAGR